MASIARASSASAQSQYIGYVYPAGGQQGTTFAVKLGGQGLENAAKGGGNTAPVATKPVVAAPSAPVVGAAPSPGAGSRRSTNRCT